MKKLLITILFILLISGCSQPKVEQPLGGGVVMKEFEVGGERVIVGGSDLLGADMALTDFKPEVKLEKWGDETYVKVWSDEKGDKTASQVNDKVVWQTPEKEYNFYTTTFEGNDAFEYEIILKEKPKSNVITLNIETKDLVFYYQPELTQEEVERGNIRPENVIGSYAVYHNSKSNNEYKTGKAFHIYRPQMEDAKGNKVWGDLNIDKGVLSVTIPQDFLDKAVYPVRHATGLTFGYTSAGASGNYIADYYNESPGQNQRRCGSAFTPSSNGTLDSITVWLSAYSIPGGSVKALINEEDSGGANSHGQLEVITKTGISPGSSAAEITFNAAGTLSLTNGTYYVLNVIGSGASCSIESTIFAYYDYDGSFTHGYREGDTNYTTPENPWTPSTNDSGHKYSIYATYTPAAASDPCTPTPGEPFFQPQDCYISTDVYHDDKWIVDGVKLIPDGGRIIID